MRANRLAHHAFLFVAGFLVAFGGAAAACSGSNGAAPGASGDPTVPSGSGACTKCVTDDDCKATGGTCSQFGSDSYCAAPCPNGNECGDGAACSGVMTADGKAANVCVPRDACGGPARSSNPPPPASTCGTLVGPDVKASCNSCGNHTCQANGCYGGWWCDTATNKCQSAPASCAAGPTNGSGASHLPGPPVTGSVGPSGGSVSRLFFAVVGDTRPASINDTSAYPSNVIKSIYQDIEASSPKPSFVVSTGDYIFASTYGTTAATQMDLYLAARASYSGTLFPTMGNHECTGATNSNCGPGTANGVTPNYTAFLDKMLAPIAQTSPNYVVNVNASDDSWTAKLVFVAGNAWGPNDAAWLDGALAQPTTYTFVIRHEPKAAAEAPGCAASEQVLANHPYTLAIVGHTHTYERSGPKQVIIGNGGAPLTGGGTYGYGLVSQRTDGAIQVDMIDYATGNPDMNFRFAVTADGSAAP